MDSNGSNCIFFDLTSFNFLEHDISWFCYSKGLKVSQQLL